MKIKSGRDEWEIRDDARTLVKAGEIRNDPTRLREAQDHIRNEQAAQRAALGIPSPAPAMGLTRRSNPATITKLNPRY